jgi:hypothetical protein
VTTDTAGADPPKPPPIEVVIVATTAAVPVSAVEPVPVVVTGPHVDPTTTRPDTFTGRPDPISPNSSIDQIKREREELRRSNDGRFTVEEPPRAALPPLPPLPPPSHRDPVFTTLAMMVVLNVAKLCLIVWILLTVLQVRGDFADAAAQRVAIASSLAFIRSQLDSGVTQQQVLINRVDDALVRLGQPSPAR